MDILVQKFRRNDLLDDTGKQIEFGSSLATNFFGFKQQTETLKLIYKSLIENDPLDNKEFNQKATISSQRGDYKIYNATDADRNVKRFFIEDLHLNENDNINDFLTLKKLNDKTYNFSWIKADSEIGKYFTTQGFNGKILNFNIIQNEIPKPFNRILFGAPGTGKSNKLNKQAEEYFSNSGVLIKQKFLDELSQALTGESKGGNICTLGIRYANYIPFDCDSVNALVKNVVEDKGKDIANVTTQLGYGMKCAENLSLNFEYNNDKKYERVTFHPNYSYAQFVGTYKPVTKTYEGKEEISYEYVPGPFIRTFINAKKTGQNVLLLIEEINRANVAAVFGDVFQLLDRDEYGNSEYPITTSEDLRKFLAKPENLGGAPDDYKTLSIPSNMYIWATMNSADQGVLPMDAAFKRRWEFEYINIDDGESALDGVTIPVPYVKKSNEGKEETIYIDVEWNTLRKAINEQLKKVSGVNEDKLLGPFFIGDKNKIENAVQDKGQFCKSFKSKVLMYLYEDVVKMQPGELFEPKDGSNIHYSDICKDFDTKGLKIFVKSIYNKFKDFKDGDAE